MGPWRALAPVGVSAPVAHHDVDGEVSRKRQLIGGRRKRQRTQYLGAKQKQLKFGKTKSRPSLGCPRERLVSLGHKIEGPVHDLTCGQEVIVGAIDN
jgi:hypothetical protein